MKYSGPNWTRRSAMGCLAVTHRPGSYYRSSRIQLDGNGAPQTIVVELKSVPGGDYEVRGALIDGVAGLGNNLERTVLGIGFHMEGDRQRGRCKRLRRRNRHRQP